MIGNTERAAKQALVLTFDLEDYRAYVQRQHGCSGIGLEEEIAPGLDAFLEFLAGRAGRREVTFFTTGEFARRHTGLLRKVVSAGHEIACHGNLHERVDRLDRTAFTEVLKTAKASLESISQNEVIGFRAPSFSLRSTHDWAFEALAEQGFQYDSSLVLEGRQDRALYEIVTPAGPIWEFPLLRQSAGVLPAIRSLGGTYLRILPLPKIKLLLEEVERQGYFPHLFVHASDFSASYFPLTYAEAIRFRRMNVWRWPIEQFVFRLGSSGLVTKLQRLLAEYELRGPLRELLPATIR